MLRDQLSGSRSLLRELGSLTVSTVQVSRGFVPLGRLLASTEDVTSAQLAEAIDALFEKLYEHPIVHQSRHLTERLRSRGLIPNEQSTENLIRFVVDQSLQRSPVPVPEALVQEFWNFFEELFRAPELKGLGELSLDMVRLVLKTYEPLLTEVVNLLKAGRRFNEWQLREVLRRAALVRNDIAIVRRQIRAIRYIKPFFAADPKDFTAQAEIVAQMVREFGPFFIKMAQVAAANADFLPEEIARELAVFHEDVPAMSAEEVNQAFIECFGKPPDKLYMDFDAERPVKSGSIGSVYFAKKPFIENGVEVLRPVVIKVGRHNIDREFVIGKLVIGLAIMSSQYWAPHSKLAPFLRALQEQADEFVAGFMEEIDFESEARHHLRFHERAQRSQVWRVPQLYGHARRILEMEYLADASSLNRALARMPRSQRRQFQSQVLERLLYTVLHHVFVYREMHGDLHPGNVMIGTDGALYLIDWGNVVPLDGKWSLVWDYLTGAMLADVKLLADAMIRISTQPQENAARRAEIEAMLSETLAKKGVQPLTRRNFIRQLQRGGMAGLHARGQTVLQLMSNTQQVGLVVQKDYLHLSRALFAAAGSFGSLYEGDPKRLLLRDLGWSLARLPLTVTQDVFHREIAAIRSKLAQSLPLPNFLRLRIAPPPRRLARPAPVLP
ncbi:AarF/ABC1/UbiB kinase family protein [Stagnimonas aquatica]|uniref:AarF/ABC1/UbiB kinase family protein n=1 Tax=Stagnimonas aquatica TaxID=2689987 RepID=A0A3N0VES7_9GAMM|nr:AarF/ABC1/UbiB kinase family protein [Stagnimonas aquatica]